MWDESYIVDKSYPNSTPVFQPYWHEQDEDNNRICYFFDTSRQKLKPIQLIFIKTLFRMLDVLFLFPVHAVLLTRWMKALPCSTTY